MQFINIVVHSVEDMNFRVHLQYEFTKLGLDEYLDVSMTRFLHVVFGNDCFSCMISANAEIWSVFLNDGGGQTPTALPPLCTVGSCGASGCC